MTVPARRLPDDVVTALDVVDLAVGVVAVAATAAQAAARTLRVGPLLAAGARPFLRVGGVWRRRIVGDVEALIPQLVDAAMLRISPTALVSRYVDLDALVATVDLDAVAANLDVEAVIARVDLDAVAERIDVDAIVDRLELTDIVLEQVDMKAVIDHVLAQMDLPALVEEVLDEIDLPEIIRDSTGSMASETVRGIRMQSADGDELVTRVVDRILMRRPRPEPGGST